jgi:hypothetical protein
VVLVSAPGGQGHREGPPAYPMIEMRKRLMAAEAEVERLREALEAIRVFARGPHNTDLAESMRGCGIDLCMGCLIEGTATAALEASSEPRP